MIGDAGRQAGRLRRISESLQSMMAGMALLLAVVAPARSADPQVIRIADKALYRAKDDGSDCARHSVSAA